MAVLVTFIYLSHADANTTKVTQCLKLSVLQEWSHLEEGLGRHNANAGLSKKNWWDNMFVFHAVECA